MYNVLYIIYVYVKYIGADLLNCVQSILVYYNIVYNNKYILYIYCHL